MAGCFVWRSQGHTSCKSTWKQLRQSPFFFPFFKSKESQLTTLKAVIHIIKHRAGEADSAASAEKSHSIQNVQEWMLSGSELSFTGPYALQGMLIGYPYLCLSSLLHFTASKGKHSKLLASSTEPLPFLVSYVGPSTLELSAPMSQLPCHFSLQMSKRLVPPCMVVLTQLSPSITG